jgi:hypothetical protein
MTVMVAVASVMVPMVVRRLRLRGHRDQQEQQQGSEKKLFHILRVTSGKDYTITLRYRNFGAVTVSKPRQSHQVSLPRLRLFKLTQITDLPHSRQTPTIELSPRSSNPQRN